MIECAHCGEAVDDVQLAMLAGNEVPRPLCVACWEFELQIAVAKCGLAVRASNKPMRAAAAAFDRMAAAMTRFSLWPAGGGRDVDKVVRELLEGVEPIGVDEDE